jgi:zinc protease
MIAESLFPHRHPYANDVIGEHEDLEAATLDDVKEFFRTYYTPNNLSLVIAGDFDPAEAKRLVEKYFGTIPPGPALDRPARGMPRLDGERVVEVSRSRAAGAHVLRVARAGVLRPWRRGAEPRRDHPHRRAVGPVEPGARVRPAACLEHGGVPVRPAADGPLRRGPRRAPTPTLDEIERIVTEEIARLAKEGPTQEELDRARTKWEFNFVTGLEAIGGFGGKADILNQYNTYLGDPGKLEEDFARYREATTASVRESVDTYLNTRNRLLVRFRPETSGRPSETRSIARHSRRSAATGRSRPRR